MFFVVMVMLFQQEYVKAASSQVQREIKVTFEDVFHYIINCWLKDGSKFGKECFCCVGSSVSNV